ncbi:unnamed protein product [Caenorhabditis auriculariae]|uniref:Galectin n=1 Tax=Caenorhabditis auriculariae TaxID=2777116 RepID=A0A8S1H206_9PELO|nr:unnamed protein product [Caenorhabditis auriculariae]
MKLFLALFLFAFTTTVFCGSYRCSRLPWALNSILLGRPLQVGDRILVHGTPNPGVPWFSVNLFAGPVGIALHFVVRWDRNRVVLNTFTVAGNAWQHEICLPQTFTRGPVVLKFEVQADGYVIYKDGAYLTKYPRRTFDFSSVQSIGFEGLDIGMAYPYFCGVEEQSNYKPNERMTSIYADGVVEYLCEFFEESKKKYRCSRLPSDKNVYPLGRALQVGDQIIVQAKSQPNVPWLSINLFAFPTGIPLHFVVRWDRNQLVLSTFTNDWIPDGMSLPQIFTRDPFIVKIEVQADGYAISKDGLFITKYPNKYYPDYSVIRSVELNYMDLGTAQPFYCPEDEYTETKPNQRMTTIFADGVVEYLYDDCYY